MASLKNTTIKLIDVSFTAHPGITVPEQIIVAHEECLGYARFLSRLIDFIIVEHIDFEGHETKNNIRYSFFKSRNKFLHIPLTTLRYISKEKPDLVLVQGTIFPLKVIVLRLLTGTKTTILVQDHGNKPLTGIKRVFQRLADACTDAYLFTAIGNLKPWIDAGIISRSKKCYELLEGSTHLKRQNKNECRQKLNLGSGTIFLWVGRLDVEKGPLTVLKGFEQFLSLAPGAKLYMIYQADTLLPDVKAAINNSSVLKDGVILVGKVAHEQLECWYSAADFYVSGSHREGAGFGLIESLACGCIPIVTDIPPFRKITGGHGFLFAKDDPASLLAAMVAAAGTDIVQASDAIEAYFKKELAFETIANSMLIIINDLLTGKPSKNVDIGKSESDGA